MTTSWSACFQALVRTRVTRSCKSVESLLFLWEPVTNIFTIVHSTIICSSTAISKALKSPEALLVGGTLLFSRLLLYVTWDQLSLVSLKESVQVNWGIHLSLLILTLSRTGCLSFGTIHPGCFFFHFASGRIFSFIFSAHQRLIKGL